MRTLASAAAVTAATAAALLLFTPAASAESAPSVVGLSESAAHATLSAAGVPYTVLNRSGSASNACTVTEQRDRGYRTEIDMVFNHDKREFDRVETQVWRGISLVVVCR